MVSLLLLALAGAPPSAPKAPTVQTASAEARPVRERQICKTETRIGTLAGNHRVCHTSAEWRAIADGARETWERLQGVQGSTHSMEPDLATPLPRP
jgi:hypothetical protein